MKQGIHPQYHSDTKVTCACGNTFITGSTQDKIDVEVCSNCHPFFTGQHKFVDIKGRIDRFREKQAKGAASQKAKKSKKSN